MFYVNLATQDFLSIFQGKCASRKRRNNQKTNTIMNNSLFALLHIAHSIHYDFICCASESISDLFHLIFQKKSEEEEKRKKIKTLNVEPAKPTWND